MVKDFITNEQRRYLGLEPIEPGWDVVAYKNRQNHKEINYLVYDGDIIRKLIIIINTGTIMLQGTKDEILASELAREIYLGKNFSM